MDRKKVLLAEDESHIAKLVEFKLNKDGMDVTWAKNGAEAIAILEQEGHWDLVILDVMMPICDGWEVLKKIRGDGRWSALPVLMLTAKGHQRDMANAAELGATHFLKKPFDPVELSSLAQRLSGSN